MSQNSYLKIHKRSTKDPGKVSRLSRPPALQTLGDDIVSAIRCLSWGSGRVSSNRSNPTLPTFPACFVVLQCLAGSVLELRLWLWPAMGQEFP